MARFETLYTDQRRVDAPLEVAVNHFADLDVIVAQYGDLESTERLGGGKIRLVQTERRDKGLVFQGRYTGEWRKEGSDRVVWQTHGDENMWNRGEARFTAVGEATEVHFTQTLVVDMPIPAILAKLARRIVERELNVGMQAYFKRMCDSVPR